MEDYKYIILGFLVGVIFAIIDAFSVLYTEKELKYYMKDYLPGYDDEEIIILISSIYSAISLLIAFNVEHYLNLHAFKHPILDAINIIIGVFIFIVIYERYIKKKKENNLIY